MYNTNYKCVKPFDVWLDAIGPDGKKIPYRVERGTIWRLAGAVASRASRNSPDRIRCALHCQMSMLRNTSRRFEHGKLLSLHERKCRIPSV